MLFIFVLIRILDNYRLYTFLFNKNLDLNDLIVEISLHAYIFSVIKY